MTLQVLSIVISLFYSNLLRKVDVGEQTTLHSEMCPNNTSIAHFIQISNPVKFNLKEVPLFVYYLYFILLFRKFISKTD